MDVLFSEPKIPDFGDSIFHQDIGRFKISEII